MDAYGLMTNFLWHLSIFSFPFDPRFFVNFNVIKRILVDKVILRIFGLCMCLSLRARASACVFVHFVHLIEF